VDAYARTIIQLFTAGAVMIPYTLLTGELIGIALTVPSLLLLIVLGVVHTGIAYALYFGSVGHLEARSVALLSYIDPVLAVLLSALFLREPFGIGSLIGAVLILGSAVYGEWEPTKKTR